MSDMIIQKEDELNKKLLVYFRNSPKKRSKLEKPKDAVDKKIIE